MALRLRIISWHREGLGERGTKEFGRAGGTIGRSLESDWVLPDAQRYISSRHASIDFRSGSYYIVDTSTNGVYVNDSDQAVGRGNPQRLFSGDRIRFGEYEISVEIDEHYEGGELDDNHVDPVARAQRVPPPDPTRADLVQPHEITAVGIEMLIEEEAEADSIRIATKLAGDSLRLEDDPPPPKHVPSGTPSAGKRAEPSSTAAPVSTGTPTRPAPRAATSAPSKSPGPASAPAKAAATASAPPKASAAANAHEPAPTSAQPAAQAVPAATKAPAAAPQPAVSVTKTTPAAPAARSPQLMTAATAAPGSRPVSGEALDAFFRGAGLAPHNLDDKQAEQALLRLGQVMREVILGLNESLRVRVEQKTALRIPNATNQLRDNNPLKFSTGVEEAIANLVLRPSSEYLQAVDAVREAFTEIKQHQQSVLSALRAAIADYVGRLDPDDLESKFSSGKRGGLMGAANKLKYWDLYRDLYQVVTQGQPGQLPQQFLEEVARAYEAEGARAGGPISRKPQSSAS
jgi:type VI secretion system protein